MEETKINKKGKGTQIFKVLCIVCLILIINAFSSMQRINDKLDNKQSYSTNTLYFAKKGCLEYVSVENKKAGMPISISLKNWDSKGGTYKISYRKSSDEDDTYVSNVTFDKKNETKIVNILKDAEAEQEYYIVLRKINNGEACLDANVFSK